MTTKYKGRKAKKQYSASEQLYDLDGTHSANSVFGKATEKTVEVKGYDGTPGAATINLGGKANTDDTIDVDNDSEDMSAPSTLTKEDLIDRLRRATISLSKGSAPTSKGSRSKASYSEGSHSSNNSSSGSSSSSSEDGSDTMNGTGGG